MASLWRRVSGLQEYRTALRTTCSSLIVVGKKQGFSLSEVFVELDIATSSLSAKPDAEYRPSQSHVLLGGPGAGKSTMARKMIMDALSSDFFTTPFLIRLREYDPEQPIEEALVRALTTYKIPNAPALVAERLQVDGSLCVLDGLDEVRPHLHEKVCDQINGFYHRYFDGSEVSKLIVTCRKEAYRARPLDIPQVCEVRPLSDSQIAQFADRWPLEFPQGKSAKTFVQELRSAPRILDLARSPLLLVGGLMQYTESNLGIPEQRVQYLSRVASWLISDWATAQGHPPDPYRQAYEKLLTKLAFFMHKNEATECPIAQVKELFRGWLPMFGIEGSYADRMIESISTKTGILVRDVPGAAIFAQFGLQEFFASRIALKELGAVGLAEMSVKPWWRETVLLSVAQETDPTSTLKAVFRAQPLIGSACVAECATPSLEMQQQAIDVALDALDRKNAAGQAPATALLRKLSGDKEFQLCSELEKRLGREPDLQKRAGIVLASADTVSASKVLLKHPEVWDKCLEGVGYLSRTFEDLLVEWISRGTSDEANRAIDLVCRSLTTEREQQLLKLLPTLDPDRQERLSSNLLRRFEESSRRQYSFDDTDLKRITTCVQYIRDPKMYLANSRAKPNEIWDRTRSPVPAALVLASTDPKQQTVLWKRLRNGVLWSRYRGALKLFIGVGLLTTAFYLARWTGSDFWWPLLFIVSALFIASAFALPSAAPPWIILFYSGRARQMMAGLAFLLGLSFMLVSSGRIFKSAMISQVLFICFITGCVAVAVYFVASAPFAGVKSSFKRWLFIGMISFVLLLVASASSIDKWPLLSWSPAALGFLYFLIFGSVSVLLYIDWRKVRKVATEAQSIMLPTGFLT